MEAGDQTPPLQQEGARRDARLVRRVEAVAVRDASALERARFVSTRDNAAAAIVDATLADAAVIVDLHAPPRVCKSDAAMVAM